MDIKSVRYLIIFFDVNNLSTLGATEKIYGKLINSLRDDGRKIINVNKDMVMFDNNSVVYKATIRDALLDNKLKGKRATHLYIHDGLLNLDNGKKFIEDGLKPIVIEGGNYLNLDAHGDKDDRIFIYNDDCEVKKYSEI